MWCLMACSELQFAFESSYDEKTNHIKKTNPCNWRTAIWVVPKSGHIRNWWRKVSRPNGGYYSGQPEFDGGNMQLTGLPLSSASISCKENRVFNLTRQTAKNPAGNPEKCFCAMQLLSCGIDSFQAGDDLYDDLID